jgi:hypothetical protein
MAQAIGFAGPLPAPRTCSDSLCRRGAGRPAGEPTAGEIIMAKKKMQETQVDPDQIEIGDQVRHAKWGVGTVLFRSGSGDGAKAIVVFPEEGQKKLMLRYAKLTKVGTTSLKSVERLKNETPDVARAKAEKLAPELEGDQIEGDVEKVADDEEEFEEEVVGFDDDEEEEEIKGRGGKVDNNEE